MKPILVIAGVAATIVVLLVPVVADAQAGRMHRATRRRTAVVVSSVTHAKDQQAAAASQQSAAAQQSTAAQQSATAEQQSATAAQQSATAQQQAAAAAALSPALALGTVVSTLPAGCVATPVGGVQYNHCGNDYYRAVFQGNDLVYVTTPPPE
jgi:hypothetical protein